MNHLTIDKLTKRYGEKLLFQDLSISINEGEKVALIAKNGKGKSTIFKILRGTEDFDDGSFRFSKHIKVCYLDQNPTFNESHTILQAVLNAENNIVQSILDYENATINGEAKKIEEAYANMDIHDAWNYERKVKKVLSEIGIKNWNQKIDTLSGGEQKRVAIARIWIEEPEMLLLDEPTNHLDVELIEWLEKWLIQSKQTLLMITHDRYFLENICNRIIEIDDQRTFSYPGNYSQYLELKATRKEIESRTVGKAKSLMRTELDWMRKQPKARTTKSKARIDSFYEIKKVATQKIDNDEFKLQIVPERLGNKIVELHYVNHHYGDKHLITNLSYKFKRYERIGIIGANGSGKSTLLKIITGNLRPQSGKVVIGETVKFGYYDQKGMQLKGDKKVIEVVRDIAEFIPMKKGKKLTASQLCERFMFDKKQQFHYVSTLSGGEKRRLYLLTILMKNPNFLILDEPTNDLDIFTLSVLEDFLIDLQANLIIVSHDRFFMDKLVEHLFVIQPNGKIEDFPGNYSQYRTGKGTFFENRKPEKTLIKDTAESKPNDSKLSYENKKKIKRIESSITKLELKKSELETELMNLADDYNKLIELQQEIDILNNTIDRKTEEWMMLQE